MREVVNRPGRGTIVINGVIYVKADQKLCKLAPGNIRVAGFRYKEETRSILNEEYSSKQQSLVPSSWGSKSSETGGAGTSISQEDSSNTSPTWWV